MKVTKKVLDALCETKLFTGVSRKLLSTLLEGQEETIFTYKKNDVIYSSAEYKTSIGFVIKGSVNVAREATGVLVKTVGKGEFFGASAVYSTSGFNAKIYATTESKVLFIDRTTLGILMIQEPAMATNYLTKLSEGINYLNEKIDTYTGGTAETKLAAYLLEEAAGYKTMQLTTAFTKLSANLNIGRASLYRAFDTFIDESIIEKDGKFIRIIDEEKLRAYAEK